MFKKLFNLFKQNPQPEFNPPTFSQKETPKIAQKQKSISWPGKKTFRMAGSKINIRNITIFRSPESDIRLDHRQVEIMKRVTGFQHKTCENILAGRCYSPFALQILKLALKSKTTTQPPPKGIPGKTLRRIRIKVARYLKSVQKDIVKKTSEKIAA